MPKCNAKTQIKKKAAKSDFAKVRHKVGRRVPLAANVTNTKIKSKRIVLAGACAAAAPQRHACCMRARLQPPSAAALTRHARLAGQTLGADRSERALTSRGLAIEEVLAQMVHYAPRVRRDAVQGMRELLGENPWCGLGRAVCSRLHTQPPRL
jgi:pre-rRNA-processing protein IPI1